MRYDVFISYSHNDTGLMQRICATLRANGLRLWTDEGIDPGTPTWDGAIEDAMKNSACVVVILTPSVPDAKGVRNEINYAGIHNIRIFPLLAAGNERTSMPHTLSSTQYVDIRQHYHRGMNKLTKTIQHYLGQMTVQAAPMPSETRRVVRGSSTAIPAVRSGTMRLPVKPRNSLWKRLKSRRMVLAGFFIGVGCIWLFIFSMIAQMGGTSVERKINTMPPTVTRMAIVTSTPIPNVFPRVAATATPFNTPIQFQVQPTRFITSTPVFIPQPTRAPTLTPFPTRSDLGQGGGGSGIVVPTVTSFARYGVTSTPLPFNNYFVPTATATPTPTLTIVPFLPPTDTPLPFYVSPSARSTPRPVPTWTMTPIPF